VRARTTERAPRRVRLGILTTHPIQYQVPWFRGLAACSDIDLTVYFAMIPDAAQQSVGFERPFTWDIPLLDGYPYRVLTNTARHPSVSSFWGCDTPEIRSIVRRGRFDAFLVNGWVAKCCLQLLMACQRHGVPCFVRGESNVLRPRAWWKRLFHRALLTRYAGVLSIGEANRQFYLARGVRSDRIFATPYCVDNQRFAATAAGLMSDRLALRDGWAIPHDACVFLYCAKFIAKKRPHDVLAALEIVARSGSPPGAQLLMVGSGELQAECQAFANQRRLPVTFAGFLNQSEICKAYVAADCLVLPSDHGETWGLVVNEAMACARPAIVSDQVGCHPDLVVPDVTGDTYPMGDVAHLAEHMRRMIADPERRRRMGAAARDRVARYSYDAVIRGTLAALGLRGIARS